MCVSEGGECVYQERLYDVHSFRRRERHVTSRTQLTNSLGNFIFFAFKEWQIAGFFFYIYI